MDTNRRYQFVNQTYEVWFGCRRDEILGKHICELRGEAAYQISEPFIDRALEGKITTFEAAVPYLLGKKYISATFIPGSDHDTQVKGYYGLITDMSEQRDAELRERKRAETASILEERNRIAREIHDTLAQVLTGVIVQMETAKVVVPENSKVQTLVNKTCDLAREGLAEARRSVWALRPAQLQQEGLSRTLQRWVTGITTGTTLQADCQIQTPPYPLPEEIETNLLRIVQEATTNTLKHARASLLLVELSFDFQAIRLRVQDNGNGFNPDCPLSPGFGLIGMRERVQNLGGQLRITSQIGQGTEIMVIVPLAAPLPCAASPGKEASETNPENGI